MYMCTFTGHLAIIDSEAEEKIIYNLHTKNNVRWAFLGYHEVFQNDDWITIKDQPLGRIGYLRWAEGEPNHDDGGNEHCGSYYESSNDWNKAGLNDINCSQRIPFTCEIEFEWKSSNYYL